jgi:hypothetical protein
MNANRRCFLRAACGVPLSVAAFSVLSQSWASGHRTLRWEDLMPLGWDPMAALKQAGLDPRAVGEGSADEMQASLKLREIWDSAPVRQDLQGTKVRLPGYVVPLEYSQGAIREFLLVPYFGACIHSPPPPANQIVLVRLDKPARLQTMDVVWVWGELIVHRYRSDWGISGYQMLARGTVPYRESHTR